MLHRVFSMAVVCLVLSLASCAPSPDVDTDTTPGPAAERPSGLVVKKPGASPGYVLFAPILSDTTYLIDEDGLALTVFARLAVACSP